jgi:hypothetical protein
MFTTGSGAGILNSETAKAQIGAVPAARAGMAGGIAATTRFMGIVMGLAGLGAVLAAVTEENLRRPSTRLVADKVIDWHTLSLRIVGGDAARGLSVLPDAIRTALEPAVHESVTAGFGAAFSIGATVAAVSGILTWLLIRSADRRPRALDAKGV